MNIIDTIPLTDDERRGKLDEDRYEYLCTICYTPIVPPIHTDPRKYIDGMYGCKQCDAAIEDIPIKRARIH